MKLWFLVNLILSIVWYSRNKSLETKSYYLSKLINNSKGSEKMDAESQWSIYVKDKHFNTKLGWTCILSWFISLGVKNVLN